ncbi:hypothetical protein JCGZ_26301 [Jatropha curcas]|uniref:Uncharacterized protein n=1 Tax=Jatropha curcas TaxID=180498 RepID=A0A067JR34_JATCU|nr:hypothetical protein JCGZ_26301 [Jatropha curcas]
MAATPKPPEAKNPVIIKQTVITAGTRTGLNMTSNGVATVSAMTVPARVKPERTRRDPPAVTAVAAFTTWWDRGCWPTCCDCGCSAIDAIEAQSKFNGGLRSVIFDIRL